jgi:predicted AAA+ superfamily ATPase
LLLNYRPMEKLIEKSLSKTNRVSLSFNRYLLNEIDWDNRLIGIKGARGTGKTTLMLQRLRAKYHNNNSAVYISMDDIYFSANSMAGFADNFVKNGGKFLFIDEVHKYQGWSRELKNIYDDYPELSIVFTSSSALEIYKGEADLSRRALVYNLNELSLREYAILVHKIEIPAVSLSDILTKQNEIAGSINQLIKPIALFNEYNRFGAYPFIAEGKTKYYERLETIVNMIIENDLPSIVEIEYQTILKIKKLLYVLAGIVPYKPNIAELSRKIGTSRDLLSRYLELLDKANLIKQLHSGSKSISYMAKPEKIYLNNSTLMYALNISNANSGTIRETFFMNQLSCRHKLLYPKSGDFIVDNKYVFEIGGQNKTKAQIRGVDDSFIAADDIEYGYQNRIPLWLFGFLY